MRVKQFEPLLSPNESPISFVGYWKRIEAALPLWCSPKFDGIRCLPRPIVVPQFNADLEPIGEDTLYKCVSRKGIPLPSRQVQQMFSHMTHMDGELIEGCAEDFDVYNRTQSHVMSFDKIGDMHYYVFDTTLEEYVDDPFEIRLDIIREMVNLQNDPRVHFVEHTLCHTLEELLAYETACLLDGYEGIMMRDPAGPYKYGRGTFKEGIIFKLKRFQDDEAMVVDFEERMTNLNVDIKDAFGRAKRSTAKSGLVGAGTVGKFIVFFNGENIPVSTGNFSHAELQAIWDNREAILATQPYLKFRHFPHGQKDRPRVPRALGWRDKIDF